MDEVLEGLGAAGMQEVQGILAALQRIQKGTYGTCVKCGKPISEERLDAPSAHTTVQDVCGGAGA
jgi:RNA polymerase-binding transcription factor DksA